jgi:hypothetical protein
VIIPKSSQAVYSETCCFRLLKPKASYYLEAQGVRWYRNLLQSDFNRLFNIVEWAKLPGHEHEKAKGHNYLAYQLWLYTFASIGIDDEILTTDVSIKKDLEEAALMVEGLGKLAKLLKKPLQQIISNYDVLEHMNLLIDLRMNLPTQESYNNNLEINDQRSILKGNRIQDFHKLHVFGRDLSRMNWWNFKDSPQKDQIRHIKNGLSQYKSKIQSLQEPLESFLDKLKKANNMFPSRTSTGKRQCLIPHLKRMKKDLKKIMTHEGLCAKDESILRGLLGEVTSHVHYIITKCQHLIAKIMEVVYFTRLCYTFIHETPTCKIPLECSYEALIHGRLNKRERGSLLDIQPVSVGDFYLVPSPDILRKVPVIVKTQMELALQ